MSFFKPIPLSLYVHIPWCVRKCPYCDFNSHTKKDDLNEINYINRLLEDLELDLPLVWGRRLISIFIGGGTPSLFSAESLNHLLSGIRSRLAFNPEIEITLEANPGTIERGLFQEYYDIGINRISLGVQSFNDQHLKKLGRIHAAQDAIIAATEIKEAGFKTFNLDIMHGLPEQTDEEALLDLKQAIDLSPTHLSWYQLTLEPNTEFYVKPPKLPGEDTLSEIEIQGKKLLRDKGFEQYEVSAYAIDKSHRCHHNLNYWQFGDYLGIGAGAHSKITNVNDDSIIRLVKQKHPKSYQNTALPLIQQNIQITKEDRPFEFMLNALRLSNGLSQTLFAERTGLAYNTVEHILNQLEKEGLLSLENHEVVPTEKGKLFIDTMTSRFLDLSF